MVGDAKLTAAAILRARPDFDRFTRLLTVLSTLAALALTGWLDSRAWPPMTAVAAAAFGLAWLGARRAGPLTAAIIAGVSCVSPLLLYAAGYFSPSPWLPWLAAIAGFSIGAAPRASWSLPHPWRLPLAYWAAAIALTWPIVVLREIDFDLALFYEGRPGVTSQGIPPAVHAWWIGSVAGAHLCGLLFVDALFRRFRDAPAGAFERAVALPFIASALVSSALAAYQWRADITFLNPTAFASIGRAVGTLFDANGHAAVSALWIGGVIALVARRRPWWIRAGATLACAVLVAGVWGSGSRTGLLIALASLSALAYVWVAAPGRMRLVRQLVMVAAIVAGGLMARGAAWPSGEYTGEQEVIGPVARIVDSLFARGRRPIRNVIQDLITRDGYGPAAVRMVAEHPLVGVGVGSFHALSLDYATRVGQEVVTDNAQNWFRHQAAEFGVIGSLGWVAWVLLFLGALALRPRGDDRLTARVLAFPLAGVGLASLVGMPTQNPAVLMSFWTLVFWHARSADRPPAAVPEPRWTRVAWPAAAFLLVLYAVFTLGAARGPLSVPARAGSFGWPYSRGFHALDAAASPAGVRWSARKGTIVVPVHGPFLRLTYWVHHPDAAERPVRVRLWIDGREVVDERIGGHETRDVYVRMRPPYAVLRAEVDRTWNPDHVPDGRQLGVGLADWRFVVSIPQGARVVN